jgi:predicted transcriptional regulator
MATVPFSMRIDSAVKKQLEREAERQDRSAAYLAQQAIVAYLDEKQARREMLREAARELDKGVFVSGEAVMAWMKSWGTDKELPMPEPDIFPSRD